MLKVFQLLDEVNPCEPATGPLVAEQLVAAQLAADQSAEVADPLAENQFDLRKPSLELVEIVAARSPSPSYRVT